MDGTTRQDEVLGSDLFQNENSDEVGLSELEII